MSYEFKYFLNQLIIQLYYFRSQPIHIHYSLVLYLPDFTNKKVRIFNRLVLSVQKRQIEQLYRQKLSSFQSLQSVNEQLVYIKLQVIFSQAVARAQLIAQTCIIFLMEYINSNYSKILKMTAEINRFYMQDQVCNILQVKNQQLIQDNMALVDEIYRLRQIIGFYELKVIELQKSEEYHRKQIETLNKSTRNILDRLQKSDQHTTCQISQSVKKLKKQLVYKRLEALQTKYENKNKECEQLLQFKDKIERLRTSWELKCKDKSLDSLFIWVYNQVVKARGFAPTKNKKSTKSFKGKNDSLKELSQNQSKILKKCSQFDETKARNTSAEEVKYFVKTSDNDLFS